MICIHHYLGNSAIKNKRGLNKPLFYYNLLLSIAIFYMYIVILLYNWTGYEKTITIIIAALGYAGPLHPDRGAGRPINRLRDCRTEKTDKICNKLCDVLGLSLSLPLSIILIGEWL